MVDISIVTPSLNMLEYLKLAHASIGDQAGVGVEHLVMDAGSTDGTGVWMQNQPGIAGVIEKDKGMYDGINKGLKRSRGTILGYLNCDEQYLPGTLAFVKDFFDRHPGVDMIFGDFLLIRPDGTLLAFRKGYQPRWRYILTSHLYVFTCTMFFRRRIIDEGTWFDPGFRATGDAHFVVDVLQKGYKACHIKRYFSAFIVTGKNLGQEAQALVEHRELLASAPAYLRVCRPLLNLVRLTEKFFSGAHFERKNLEYEVYTMGEKGERVRQLLCAPRPSFEWRLE